jgi:predicted nucleotidyltransferase
MTSISYNLSGKVDSSLAEVLQRVNQVATALGIRFFVVGAMARIIVLEYCHDIRPARGTRDLDIAVEVKGWDEFHRLTEGLVDTGNFSASREPQTFRSGAYRVDIVPFGRIADARGKISWPPEHEVFMTTMGVKEAHECAMNLRLSDQPALDIKVATIPGLALMKVISWHDSYPERPKDAEDLLILMNHYSEAGNEERLYEEENELLQAEGFDLVIAGIRLLGRDMARIAKDPTGKVVASILQNEIQEEHRYRLVQDMIKGARIFDKFSETLEKLKKLAEGFNAGLHKKNSHSSG